MVKSHSEATRALINRIGSGEIGYLNKPVSHAIELLDSIASDETMPEALRSKAAYAAANLVLAELEEN